MVAMAALPPGPPVLAGIENSGRSYQTGSPAVPVTSSITVSTSDGTDLTKARVAISSGYLHGRDLLSFNGAHKITGTFNAATGVLTLKGKGTASTYQAALRSVKFSTAGSTRSGPRTVSFQVDDGRAVNHASNVLSRALSVVHPAPVVTTTAGQSGYTQGQAPVVIDGGIKVKSPSGSNLTSAQVAITTGFGPGDTLGFTDVGKVTGSYDPADGVLTVSGTATAADYQFFLRSVTYSTGADIGPATSSTVVFTVSDGIAGSNFAVKDITTTLVAPRPPPSPVVTTTAGATPYTQDRPPVLVDGGVTVANPSGAPLVSGEVEVTSGFQTGDLLGFTNLGAVTGSYNSANGVLTVSGTGTAAQYQAFFQSVTYTSGTNPNPGTARTIGFMVSDSVTSSNLATKDITITLHSAAVLANIEGTALAYNTGSGPAPVTSALTVTAPDDTDLASATVSISAGYLAGQDTLSFTNTATLTGNFDATTGVLTLSGTDTVANYQAALRSVTFSTAASTPSGSRMVSFQVDDGHTVNHASNVVSRNVTVTHQAPVVTITAGATAYTQDHPPVTVDPALTVASPSGADLVSAQVEVATGFQPGDTFAFTGVGAITGSYDNADGVLTLTGTASAADYQSVLRSVTYTSGTNPSPGTARTISFMVSDSVASSSAATKDITITLHSAPVLANIEGTALAYNTGSGPAPVTSALTVTAPDDTDLASATVSISAGYLAGQDSLSFTNTPTITGSFDASTGVLTLSGTDTVANYQAALRSVTFSAAASTSSGSRTVSFQVDDGQAVNHASNIANRDVTVTHQAPLVTTTSGDHRVHPGRPAHAWSTAACP